MAHPNCMANYHERLCDFRHVHTGEVKTSLTMNLSMTVLTGVMTVLAAAGAASVGFVPRPDLGAPVWYVLVTLTVGYWAVFLRWARR